MWGHTKPVAQTKKTKLMVLGVSILGASLLIVATIVKVVGWSVDSSHNGNGVAKEVDAHAPVENAILADNSTTHQHSVTETDNQKHHNSLNESQQKSTGSVGDSDQDDSAYSNFAPNLQESINEPNDINETIDTVAFDVKSGGAVKWKAPTKIAYKRADITIVGSDGQTISQSYGPGEQIVLNKSLADGTYKWESVVSPQVDNWVREEMRRTRELNDPNAERELLNKLRSQGSLPSEAQARENRQSGSFTVKDGVAYPNYMDNPNSSDQDS